MTVSVKTNPLGFQRIINEWNYKTGFFLIYKTPKKIQSIEFFDLLILFIDYTYHRPICKLFFFCCKNAQLIRSYLFLKLFLHRKLYLKITSYART